MYTSEVYIIDEQKSNLSEIKGWVLRTRIKARLKLDAMKRKLR